MQILNRLSDLGLLLPIAIGLPIVWSLPSPIYAQHLSRQDIAIETLAPGSAMPSNKQLRETAEKIRRFMSSSGRVTVIAAMDFLPSYETVLAFLNSGKMGVTALKAPPGVFNEFPSTGNPKAVMVSEQDLAEAGIMLPPSGVLDPRQTSMAPAECDALKEKIRSLRNRENFPDKELKKFEGEKFAALGDRKKANIGTLKDVYANTHIYDLKVRTKTGEEIVVVTYENSPIVSDQCTILGVGPKTVEVWSEILSNSEKVIVLGKTPTEILDALAGKEILEIEDTVLVAALADRTLWTPLPKPFADSREELIGNLNAPDRQLPHPGLSFGHLFPRWLLQRLEKSIGYSKDLRNLTTEDMDRIFHQDGLQQTIAKEMRLGARFSRWSLQRLTGKRPFSVIETLVRLVEEESGIKGIGAKRIYGLIKYHVRLQEFIDENPQALITLEALLKDRLHVDGFRKLREEFERDFGPCGSETEFIRDFLVNRLEVDLVQTMRWVTRTRAQKKLTDIEEQEKLRVYALTQSAVSESIRGLSNEIKALTYNSPVRREYVDLVGMGGDYFTFPMDLFPTWVSRAVLKSKIFRGIWAEAAFTLGVAGDAHAIEFLIKASSDSDRRVRRGAIWALSNLGYKDLSLIRNEDRTIRDRAGNIARLGLDIFMEYPVLASL